MKTEADKLSCVCFEAGDETKFLSVFQVNLEESSAPPQNTPTSWSTGSVTQEKIPEALNKLNSDKLFSVV